MSNVSKITVGNSTYDIKDADARQVLDALGTAATKDSTNSVTAGSADLVESGAVKNAIDTAVSSAYHAAGTKTVAELTSSLLIAANEGNVYNMTDSGTTTADFIEGQGKPINEGDNVGVAKVGSAYKFDLLSGFVDLSNYVQKSSTAGLIKNDGTIDTNSYALNNAVIKGVQVDGTDLTKDTNGKVNINNKATRPSTSTAGNIATLTAQGDLADGGFSFDKDGQTATGNPLFFTTDSAQVASDCKITLEPIQEGSGDPSPSNVRAISGYNKISILGCKQNLVDPTKLGLYQATAQGDMRIGIPFLLEAGAYIVEKSGGSASLYLTNVTANYTFDAITTFPYSFSLSETSNILIRLGSDSISEWDIINLYVANSDEPYNPVTDITLNLPETVYGGTLDVESGELVVDKGIVDLGDLEYSVFSTDNSVYRNTIAINNLKPYTNIYLICSCYKSYTGPNPITGYSTASAYLSDKEIASGEGAGNVQVYIKDNSYSGDVSALKTALTGQKLVYELATPYTIHLTPAQVNLLKGTNTVTTNGTTITLKYRDGELAKLEDLSGIGESINKLGEIVADNIEVKANKTDIAYMESGTTASQAYSEGDLVYFGGVLYKVLTAISSGQSFTIGTNVAVMSVMDRIREVDTQLQLVGGNARSNITSKLGDLSTAIAEQNLEKYGYKIGDYFTGVSGYTYHLADLDPFFGGYNSYATITSHHVGIVVDTKTTSKWNETADISSVNYKDSTLHTFLSTTVLDNIKSDLTALFSSWESHLIAHDKLYAKLGSWAWSSTNTRSEYISALTECQMYGSPIWSADNYQQGEGSRQLELFRRHTWMRVFGNTAIWLRSISMASSACIADSYGIAYSDTVTYSYRAAGLILFK